MQAPLRVRQDGGTVRLDATFVSDSINGMLFKASSPLIPVA